VIELCTFRSDSLLLGTTSLRSYINSFEIVFSFSFWFGNNWLCQLAWSFSLGFVSNIHAVVLAMVGLAFLSATLNAFNLTSFQGGVIPVNLLTRLTSNKIFVGSPALCRENKLWVKCHQNKIPVTQCQTMTGIKFLAKERKVSCHKNKNLVTRTKFLSQEQNSYPKYNIPVTRINFL
jgi:hypothetical protein